MDRLEKDQVKHELYDISQLHNKEQSLSTELGGLLKEEFELDKASVLKAAESMFGYHEAETKKYSIKNPAIAADCLTEFPEPPRGPVSKSPLKEITLTAGSGLALIGSIALMLIFFIFNIENPILMVLIYMPIMILFFASIYYWAYIGRHKAKKFFEFMNNLKAWEAKYPTWENSFNKAATKEEQLRFLNEFMEYDRAFTSIVSACDKKRPEFEAACLQELKNNEKTISKKREDLKKQLDETIHELYGEPQIIDSELFPIAWRIRSALDKGRADTLKEAINIALEDERKEKEEAERQEEARRQEAILEQQAAETRRSNAAMEQAARDQAKAASEQAKAAKAQADFQKKQADDALRAARSRCSYCKNRHSCPNHLKMNPVNCHGFSPR